MSCSAIQPKIVSKLRSRLTDFRVDEIALARSVSVKAATSGEWQTATNCGGQISSRERRQLGKAPLTEVALAVSDPHGLTVVWLDSCDGYGVTPRKAAASILAGDGRDHLCAALAIFDRRVKSKERKQAGWEHLRSLHDAHFSAMEKLASAST